MSAASIADWVNGLLFERTKKTNDPVLIANAEGELREARKELDFLGSFKAPIYAASRATTSS